jgi:hypothetical protein
MSVSRVTFKIVLTETKLDRFDRISCKFADRCIENNGGRGSELALVLAKVKAHFTMKLKLKFVITLCILVYSPQIR